jgi:hypothetical protein
LPNGPIQVNGRIKDFYARYLESPFRGQQGGSRLKLKVPTVNYIQSDWMGIDLSSCDPSRGLCYFDDHIDQAKRLIEAGSRHIPTAIFDDDFPVTAFAPMAHEGQSLPKVEFVLDVRLREEQEIRWLDRGVQYSWRSDGVYLDRAKSVIKSTERLPNTSLITGIHQTPSASWLSTGRSKLCD